MDGSSTVSNSSVTGGPSCNSSEEYKFTVYAVVYSLVFIFGLLSNMAALYVFVCLSKKNRVSTIFLINLAISDLIFILSLPLRIAYNVSQAVSASEPGPLLGLACRVSTYLFYISMYCSILFLTGLSVCRYLVLAGHIHLQNRRVCWWVRLVCLAVWVLVVGGNITQIAVISGFKIKVQGCFEPRASDSWGVLYQINIYTLVLAFVVPLLTVLTCYALMIRHILGMQRGHRRRDAALICLVLTVFCVCFLPYHVQRTLHLYYVIRPGATCQFLSTLQKSVVVTLCFAAANSCLDPLIFVFVGHGFIPALRTMVRSCKSGPSCSNPPRPSTPLVTNHLLVNTTEV
ncbi:lysophosphatidic acid receptor 6-like [Megalops cyprinoides]|uniref:lysophosphatidic acid receptor 6-like n=1 Tax=Megalops cyprinoides TaxID=118141 RepID=UPI0018641C3D|nr:lysophosphatidic acid receptor 6-like [Megalops cyprinoides]